MQFHSLCTALQTTFHEISDLHRDDPIPQQPWTVIHNIEGDTIETDLELRLDLDLYAARICKDIFKLTTLSSLFDTVKGDPALDVMFYPPASRVADEPFDRQRLHLGGAFIGPFIRAYIAEKGNVSFDSGVFDRVVQALLDGLLRDRLEASHVTLLANAKVAGSPISLGEGWTLRAVTISGPRVSPHGRSDF